MSRSFRQTPITGITTSDSEKQDKAKGHRRTRVAVRVALARDDDPPSRKLTENPWDYAKDGKKWRGSRYPKLLRK